ncbi:MAG: hypothetical protein R2814_12360 [Flavobacteriaceae bacterium]
MMKGHFDEELAQKIRDIINDHEEAYEAGAWERFLTRKKNKKNRIYYWYLTGIASSVLLFITIVLITKNYMHETIHVQNPITVKEGPPILSRILDSVSIEEINGEGSYVQKEDSIINKMKTKIFTNRHSLISQINNNNGFAQEDGRVDGFFVKNRTVAVISKHLKTFANDLSIDLVDIDLLRPTYENNGISSIQLEPPITVDESKKIRSDKTDIEVGIQISPSYGASNAFTQSLASTNFGGGVTLNLPIKNSGVAINTGVIFNNLRLTNEESILALSEDSVDEDTFYKEETSLYNFDIPINIMYKIPSKRNYIYVQAGMSSYITFNESVVSTQTTLREVEVFHDVDGNTQSTRITESVSSKVESDYQGGKLHPLGTFNISIGYKAPLTDRLKYEIQPFYKIPLNSLTADDVKIPMGGISLRISITP